MWATVTTLGEGEKGTQLNSSMMLYRTNQVTLPDPDGQGGQASPEYTYVYDAAGQLTSETDPLARQKRGRSSIRVRL
jgi:hypothetical protein